jgi:lipoprotein NlpI
MQTMNMPLAPSVGRVVSVVLAATLALRAAAGQSPPSSPLEQARRAQVDGKSEEALKLASRAVEMDPQDMAARLVRASIHDALRQHQEAIADYDAVLAEDAVLAKSPAAAQLFHLRGRSRFKAGDVAGSIEDFDRAAELDPRLDVRLWERGISYYYAGEFAAGARQFQEYQTFDASDVENVVWRFACQARADGFDQAKRDIMPLEREDRRVPMMTVYALFRGEATPEDVLAAARAGEPSEEELRHRLFYAHLYVALHYDAQSNSDEALRHMRLAEEQKISHYMWDVAHVHLARLGSGKKN